jgi:LmbE family N-acetylglucosaminyl deacetylase
MNSKRDSRRILAAFAHPDDECFGTGGTLAAHAREGAEVVLVCATRGEEGEIADPSLATPATLAEVREGELRCSADILGLSEVVILGYRDSGMAGTTANGNPNAYVNAPDEEVVARLVGIIRRLRPQVVLTFDPNGAYGHPDHIAIHRHTVAAFHAAADPHYRAGEDEPWQADRLFYTVVPRGTFLEFRARLAEIGADTSELDEFEEAGEGWPDDEIHVTMDVSHTVDAKWDSLDCHRTQFGSGAFLRELPNATAKEVLSREHFFLAWPEPRPGTTYTTLFDGLRDNEWEVSDLG